MKQINCADNHPTIRTLSTWFYRGFSGIYFERQNGWSCGANFDGARALLQRQHHPVESRIGNRDRQTPTV